MYQVSATTVGELYTEYRITDIEVRGCKSTPYQGGQRRSLIILRSSSLTVHLPPQASECRLSFLCRSAGNLLRAQTHDRYRTHAGGIAWDSIPASSSESRGPVPDLALWKLPKGMNGAQCDQRATQGGTLASIGARPARSCSSPFPTGASKMPVVSRKICSVEVPRLSGSGDGGSNQPVPLRADLPASSMGTDRLISTQ